MWESKVDNILLKRKLENNNFFNNRFQPTACFGICLDFKYFWVRTTICPSK